MAKRGRTPGFIMSEHHRTKIAKSRILGNLIKYAEGDDTIITKPQADIGVALLRKVMPDLSTVTLEGGDEPLNVVHTIERKIVKADD